jgi:hypothetical protein
MVDMYVDGRGREAYLEVAGKLGIDEDESEEFVAAMKRHEQLGA